MRYVIAIAAIWVACCNPDATVYGAREIMSAAQCHRYGDHCFYGYEGHEGGYKVYCAGGVSSLNADLTKYAKGPRYLPNPRLILHVGKHRVNVARRGEPKEERRVDWTVESDGIPNVEVGVEGRRILHVWLGDKIQLEDLEVPKVYEVVSGGEIEEFVEKHQRPNQEP